MSMKRNDEEILHFLACKFVALVIARSPLTMGEIGRSKEFLKSTDFEIGKIIVQEFLYFKPHAIQAEVSCSISLK